MNTPPVPYIELNLSNYDAEDVAQLNEWAIWASYEIELLRSHLLLHGRHLNACSLMVSGKPCDCGLSTVVG